MQTHLGSLFGTSQFVDLLLALGDSGLHRVQLFGALVQPGVHLGEHARGARLQELEAVDDLHDGLLLAQVLLHDRHMENRLSHRPANQNHAPMTKNNF